MSKMIPPDRPSSSTASLASLTDIHLCAFPNALIARVVKLRNKPVSLRNAPYLSGVAFSGAQASTLM